MDWKDVDTTHCGVAACARIMGDKWSILILRDIFQGISRFDHLQRHTGASSAMVADRLKRLTDDGVLEKSEYRDPGKRPRMQYRLTARGRDLRWVIMAMAQFGYDHVVAPENRLVSLQDRESGRPLHLAMVDDTGRVIPDQDIRGMVNNDVATRKPPPAAD